MFVDDAKLWTIKFVNYLLTTSPCDLDEIIYNVHAQQSSSEANTAASDSSNDETEPSATISVSKGFQ